MSYKDLEIWKLAMRLSVEVHRMTREKIPKFENYETGSQIRRSAASVRSNIVEGYGRRRYKQDYIRFLVYSLGSCIETMDHLEYLFETGSLEKNDEMETLHKNYDKLGRMINKFIQSVEAQHMTGK